jgi:hypothetical protein
MSNPVETFKVLRGVLSNEDLSFLKDCCKEYIRKDGSIPSYILLDKISSQIFEKIVDVIRESIGRDVFYLNDFYIYSDDAFGAKWHMDTELFTFADCLNAWILLSPDELSSPLAMLSSPNDSDENHFHSAKIEGEDCTFVNYRNGKRAVRSLVAMESEKIEPPRIHAGDILLLNPKKFHKTNSTAPKHALVLKFVIEGEDGFFAKEKVPPIFWAETGIFTELLKKADTWADFLAALRLELTTEKGRKALSAGFFPEKMDLYKKVVETL